MKARSQKVEQSGEAPKLPPPPSIKRYSNGIAQFPIAELRDWAIATNVPDKDCLSYALQFECGEPEIYNYALTQFDRKMEILIERIYYIDVAGGPDGTDLREEVNANDTMKRAILRRFFTGEASVCGIVNVDEEGRLWVDVLAEDNLESHLVLFLQPGEMGCEFEVTDPETLTCVSRCRVSFDGASFFYEPVDLSVNVPLS